MPGRPNGPAAVLFHGLELVVTTGKPGWPLHQKAAAVRCSSARSFACFLDRCILRTDGRPTARRRVKTTRRVPALRPLSNGDGADEGRVVVEEGAGTGQVRQAKRSPKPVIAIGAQQPPGREVDAERGKHGVAHFRRAGRTDEDAIELKCPDAENGHESGPR